MMTLNDFFAANDLSVVEIFQSPTYGDYRAVRNSTKRLLKDSIYGAGATPEAALADLMAKVNATAPPAPVAIKPSYDDLDDLLG